MKKSILPLFVAATLAGCVKTAPINTTSTTGTNANWTVDGKNYSTGSSGITSKNNILTALEESSGATFVINSGPYPFPAKDDSFLIADIGTLPVNGNSLYVQVSLLDKVSKTSTIYMSVLRGQLKYATIKVTGGKASVTIPEIWVYEVGSTSAEDSLKMSGTISQ